MRDKNRKTKRTFANTLEEPIVSGSGTRDSGLEVAALVSEVHQIETTRLFQAQGVQRSLLQSLRTVDLLCDRINLRVGCESCLISRHVTSRERSGSFSGQPPNSQ